MYKILLVDDEEMVLKSLKATVNWQEYGFEIIGSATSAQEALDKISLLKPNVVITDIKMPNINGLELLQMIKAINAEIYCIVISGHAEFAYIQKSIRLEAVGYCLKPFDADEVAVYLKRIKIKLDNTEKAVDKSDYILDAIQSTSADSLSYMHNIYTAKNINFTSMKIYVMYIRGIETIEGIDNLLAVKAGFQKYIFLIHENHLLNITEEYRDINKNMIHIGISKSVVAYDKVSKAIRESRSCAYQFFCQESSESIITHYDFHRDMALLQALEKDLEYSDSKMMRKHILEISDKFINGEYNIDFAIRLQNIYATWISKFNKNKEVEFIYDYEVLCKLYHSVFKLLNCIESDFNEIKQNTNFQNNISNKTFRTIFRYIEENYMKQINITQLSDEFHINACYFSQLFKKEMGCTFTEYITSKRIEYSVNLLRDTDLKINEISEMSGFGDYFYFSRVFRKIKKCSPTEYRSNR